MHALLVMFDCLVAQTSTRALWKYASMESGALCVTDLIIGGDPLATHRNCCLQAVRFLKFRLVADIVEMPNVYSLCTSIVYYRGNITSICILWPRKWANIHEECAMHWKGDTPHQLLLQYFYSWILLTLQGYWSGVPRWVVSSCAWHCFVWPRSR